MGQLQFADLPATSFPFIVEGIDGDTQETLWQTTVNGPGVLSVPGKPEGVREVKVRITFHDGIVIEK